MLSKGERARNDGRIDVAQTENVRLARRAGNAAWVGFTLTWFVTFCLVFFRAPILDGGPVSWVPLIGLALTAVLVTVHAWADAAKYLGVTTLAARGVHLRVAGERRIIDLRHEDLAQAVLWPGGVVVSDRRGREIRAPMNRPAASRLIDDLELGVRQRHALFRLRVGPRRVWPYAFGFTIAAILLAVPCLFDAAWVCVAVGAFGWVPFAAAELSARWWTWVTVVVGFDGVYAAWGPRRVFVPFAAVATLASDQRALKLTLHGGRVVRIPCDVDDPSLAQALHDRAAAAGTMANDVGPAPPLPTFAQRGKMAVPDWLIAARSDHAARATYRTPATAVDPLREVLEAPLAAYEQRIGAAMALAALDRGDDRARVLRIAEACASARLGSALRAIAEGRPAARKIRSALAEAARAAS